MDHFSKICLFLITLTILVSGIFYSWNIWEKQKQSQEENFLRYQACIQKCDLQYPEGSEWSKLSEEEREKKIDLYLNNPLRKKLKCINCEEKSDAEILDEIYKSMDNYQICLKSCQEKHGIVPFSEW